MNIINFISEKNENIEIPCEVVHDVNFSLFRVTKKSLQDLISNDIKIVKRTLTDGNEVWYKKDDKDYIYYY